MTPGKNCSDVLAPKVPYPPKTLAISTCDGKTQAIAILLAIFPRKKRPYCGLASDGDVCDRKSRPFAVEFKFRILVFSVEVYKISLREERTDLRELHAVTSSCQEVRRVR